MTYSAIINDELNAELLSHLIRADEQEDLCFATYVPSSGSTRFTGILRSVVLPQEGEREVHGNVSFHPRYFERALRIAAERHEGLAFIHSHTGPGWQDMSPDDVIAETLISPSTKSITRLPLMGLTVGTDGSWSARFWIKRVNEKRSFERKWCENVRTIGKKLSVTFNDQLLPPTFDSKKQLRTISAWGKKAQEDLSRIRICIVGLGSVGSMVAEILARTGFSDFTLIDFDLVEEKNLDRLTGVFTKDIGKPKVIAVQDSIQRSATSPTVKVYPLQYSVCEKIGFQAALNCDVIFCCVDRPWPRQCLNFIAYAHLIPVIDGGILVRTNKDNSRIKGADWKAHLVGYKCACLECLGQYKTENAKLERDGYFDDPEYIKGLPKSAFIDAHENVFAFSSHLASLEVLQLLSFYLAPSGISKVGQQMHHFVTGRMDVEQNKVCLTNCYFTSISGMGDCTGVEAFGLHKLAEEVRSASVRS